MYKNSRRGLLKNLVVGKTPMNLADVLAPTLRSNSCRAVVNFRRTRRQRRIDRCVNKLDRNRFAAHKEIPDNGRPRMKTITTENTPNQLDVALGLRIRQRRKALGVSQTALADAVGLTFQQIQKYERGFNRVSFSRLVDIAHALDCRAADLVGDLDDANLGNPLFRQNTSHLRESGAPELLAAYSAAPPLLRGVILKLVVEIAKDQHAPQDDDGGEFQDQTIAE